VNLLDLLEIQYRERPDAVALHEPSGRSYTYRELFEETDAFSTLLASRGLTRGDRVAVFSENRPDLVPAYLAILRVGALAVPINTAYRPREIAHVLTDAEPRLLITDPDHATLIDHLPRPDRRSIEAVLPLPVSTSPPPQARSPNPGYGTERGGGETAPRVSLAGAVQPPREHPGPSPTDSSSKRPPASPQGSEPALLIYTSGTTGASKGATLTHDNLLATINALRAAWAWRPADTLLLTLPLFHVHGLVVGLLTALAAGARVELRRRFDAAAVARELTGTPEPGGATPSVFFGVPTMYVRLVQVLRRLEGSARLSHIRLFASGSAPLAPETFHAFRALTGHEILERYGMSEAGMLLSNPYAGARRPGTVGTPLPGVSIRIVDPETAEDVAPGADGELLVSGANVFAGYWRAPEKTAESLVTDADGHRWFRTGDLARQDPETGYVTLLGRRHELVIRGGYNVYPREVEEVLEGHPAVREAAVAGRPDPEWGEVPVAWVVCEAAAPDPEAILAWCRDRLAPFKVPAEIRLVGELPRNALGKLQKHRLRE
jgi:malonyl-CoA/methylmalonyl-CoA synthetase